MASEESRFEIVTRRAFVQRSLLAGAAVLVGGGALAACGGNGDAETFDTGGASTAGSTAPSTRVIATTVAAPADSAAPAGDPLPAAAELQVAFTFASASDGRPAKNPYIGVWIEDAAGEMVQTVSLWIQTGGKGQRYWRELTRWYGQEAKRVSGNAAKATVDTITGATRTAGDYTVAWNGTDYSGARVGQGQYWLCIEASREHGPYELIREQLTLGTEAFDKALTAKGELTAATVTYVA